ncbi:hypothetical protein [Halorarum salinum]|uniref:Uncharacterized protein n=1 Tax=Halorarum salinum TaxID=2743089 RepID=A0A7D5LAJ4_9EURY|nr:hypothetical protein [Halobaculum salinum]QLG61890.1 hypothetical protein HUG12_09225 [Halobaculum salinum]
MATRLVFLLLWVPIGFALLVGASYLGTKLALRSYFDDDEPPSSLISIEDVNDDR